MADHDTPTRKVLYIQCDQQNVELITLILKRYDIEVLWATTSEEGLILVTSAGSGRVSLEPALPEQELIAKVKPDLILLELMMPGIDGFQILEHLRADTDLQHIPVVVVSAKCDSVTIARCLAMRATSFLSLPFSPGQLMECANKILAAKLINYNTGQTFQ